MVCVLPAWLVFFACLLIQLHVSVTTLEEKKRRMDKLTGDFGFCISCCFGGGIGFWDYWLVGWLVDGNWE